jgi:hypothetical protein
MKLPTTRPLVYTAQSKQDFYCRDAVCQFVFERGGIPLNPFRLFDYYLGDRVPRDQVRDANRRVLESCDEVWVFGLTLADGVLVEIAQASLAGKRMRYFTISPNSPEIREATPFELDVENEVRLKLGLALDELIASLRSGRSEAVVHALGRSSELSDR